MSENYLPAYSNQLQSIYKIALLVDEAETANLFKDYLEEESIRIEIV